MKRAFDKDDILRFIYDELNEEEHAAFVEALCDDEVLFEEYENLKDAQESLAIGEMSPSEKSLSTVMSFARKSLKERPGATFIYGHSKNKLVSLNHLVSVVMVFFTLGTVLVAMIAYQKAASADNDGSSPSFSLEWENTELNQRLEFAKFNLQNIRSDSREALMPVYHDTYRVVNTSNFSGPRRGIQLLNIK